MKYTTLFLLTILGISLTSCSAVDTIKDGVSKKNDLDQQAPFTQKNYSYFVKEFKELNNIEKLNQLITSNKTSFIYMGYPECPYCNIFVPKLYEAMKQTNSIIYYFDTHSMTNKLEEEQFDKLATNIGLEYVPSMYYFNNGEFKNLNIDSTTTIDELIVMLNKSQTK